MTCEIRVCDSGHVSLVFGNVSVNFLKDDFYEFARGTGLVAAQLNAEDQANNPHSDTASGPGRLLTLIK